MSTINLTSYFTYLSSQKPTSVELQDVALPESITHIQGALLTLYGFRDVLDEVSRIHQSIKPDMIFCTVNIEVDVNELERNLVSSENLLDNDFINLRRITAELRDLMVSRWNSYLKEEGVDKLTRDEIRNMTFVGRRPDLLERLHQEKMFNHVTMFIFPVQYGSDLYQRAALFGFDKVLSVTAKNHPEISVTLPKS